MKSRAAEAAIAALCGLLFGLGLILSGMTDPARVQDFLDPAGSWNPSLAFVMAGAIGVAVLPFQWLRRRQRTLGGAPLQLPASHGITPRLVLGSVLFGIGWGLAGFCPGPALVGLGSAWQPALIFCAGMLGGFGLFSLLPRRPG